MQIYIPYKRRLHTAVWTVYLARVERRMVVTRAKKTKTNTVRTLGWHAPMVRDWLNVILFRAQSITRTHRSSPGSCAVFLTHIKDFDCWWRKWIRKMCRQFETWRRHRDFFPNMRRESRNRNKCVSTSTSSCSFRDLSTRRLAHPLRWETKFQTSIS
jgi:hypothetical protein